MKRFLSIFLAIFALTFAACTSSEEENGNNSQGGGDKPSSQPEVTITTPPAPTVSEKGGNDIIAFHAEKPWSAKVLNTRAEGWCSIYPTSGQAGDVEITITTAPNDTDDDRSATIIIQAGSTQIVITITQKQQDALTVTASKFEVEAEGGEVEIEVKANVDYDYTIDPDAADWVKYKATRALESSTLVFEVAENEDMEKREAQIMIHSGDLEELVTIYQEGNEPTIILSKNEYTVSDKGETIAVEVKSNVDVAVEIPSDVDWVKENSTRAMSTNTFYLDVAPNEDYKSRSAAVKFTNKENGLSEIVMISQAQMDAIVIAKDSYTIDNEGGEIDIEVGHNVDFDVEISDNWITKTSTRAFETETLTFTIAANNSDDSREGTIKFISKDKAISQTVKVFQSQSNALIVSKKDIVIDEKAQSVEFEVRANVEYTVSSSSSSWLHREDTRAMTSQTIRYRVDANSDYDSRTATITVQSKDGSLKETITVTQAQKDAIVLAKNSYTVDNDGGEIDIEVGHNVDFDVEISDNWITKTSTRAFETETLTFTIAANNSDDSREGTIKFISKDKSITQTVKVFQSQSNALIVSKKDIVIDEKSQSVEFEVRANVEYTVSASSASWLHRENTRAMTSQTIRYRVDANSSYDSRTATITVQSKDGSLKETITVTQAQKDAIVLAKNSYTVDNDGGEIDIEVGHNVDFDIEISDSWITKTSTRAFETETLTFTIAANNSDDSREGTIKFISKDKTITQTVKVYQSQSNALIVSKKDIVIDEKEQSVEFEVRANVEYTVSASSASWLHREDTRAMTSQTLRYRVDANNSYDSRTATITVQSKDGSLKETITVTQAQKDAIVLAKSSYTVDNDGGEIDIEVGHNVDFDVEISDNWITKTSTRVFETETLTFTIAANNSDDSREGTIKFISKDKAISQTVKIEQKSNYDPTKPRNNEIWYTTTDGKLLDPYKPDFGANIVSNTYENGKGVITFDGDVKYIGHGAYHGCEELATITLPNSITKIEWQAFRYCRKLTSINIPNNVTLIGSEALASCESLTNIIIPNSVTEIGYHAFYGCNKLTSITIPNSVTNLGNGVFGACNNLKAFYGEFASVDNRCLIIDGVLKAFAPADLTSYSISNSVTNIDSYTFESCRNLQSITIPDSMTSIGTSAFFGCISLKAFYGKFASADNRCLIIDGALIAFAPADLTSYSIPDNVTEIGNSVFLNFRGQNITIPKNVTKIGYRAFDIYNITSLYCKPTTPPQIGLEAFYPDAIIYVPDESYNQYIANQQWSKYNIVSESNLNNSPDKATLIEFYNSTNGDNWTNNTNWCSDRPINEWYGISVDAQGHVKEIDLSNNNLTGCLPDNIGDLTKLERITIASNYITGSIPESFGRLTNLKGDLNIQLQWNGLSGRVPESVMQASYWSECWPNIIDQDPKRGGGISREGLVIPARKFEVTTIDGVNISDDIYSKNKLTIMYHFYDWCPYSTIFTPRLKNIYNEYKNRGVDVLCFSNESSNITEMNRKIEAYRDKFELPWHCFSGWSFSVTYFGSPIVDVVNQDGYIVFNRALDDYNDLGDFLKEYFNDDYSSTDYSQDGKVTKLQSATKGNGIDIVLMGDAFTDRLIADGTYEKTMRTAMEKFFTEEPYKSYRDHFNVYSVTAVSKNDIYGEGYETAFSGFFGEGTHVGGDNAKVLQYAQKAISDDRIDKSLMIVMMNSTSYAGTCYMYYSLSGDYGNGASISYFPIGADDIALEQTLHHEAGGHGFAKLGDEYAYEEYGTIPAAEVQSHSEMEVYGWWKNVDFTSDPTKVKWAHFLSDTRYANDGLGVFEGGLTYWRGVWRPTENSIMRYNTGGFNAPSREAIYYRIHKLAYGDSWQYDYEEFVEWDAKNRKTAATRGVPYRIETPKNFKPLAPPVVIEKSWRDAK